MKDSECWLESMNYRSTARTHCQSAKDLLSSGTDDDVLLAALKLRMSHDRSVSHVLNRIAAVSRTFGNAMSNGESSGHATTAALS